LQGATWETERAPFLRNVYDTIDEIAPGFSDGVIAEQVLLPPDIERIINTPHGHIFHGELALEQLFFQRPAPHYSGLPVADQRALPVRIIDASRRRRFRHSRAQRGPRDPERLELTRMTGRTVPADNADWIDALIEAQRPGHSLDRRVLHTPRHLRT
jgi:hypothetical protein